MNLFSQNVEYLDLFSPFDPLQFLHLPGLLRACLEETECSELQAGQRISWNADAVLPICAPSVSELAKGRVCFQAPLSASVNTPFLSVEQFDHHA